MGVKIVKLKTHPLVELSVKVTDEMIEDYKDCQRKAQVLGGGKNCENCSWNNVIICDDVHACCTDMEALLEEAEREEKDG